MKKLIGVLFFAFVGLAVNAQSTLPRWGSGANNDNTGRALHYNYKTIADATGTDTVSFTPAAWETVVRVALTDSICVSFKSLATSYAGDIVKFIASGTSGSILKFTSTNSYLVGGSKATLSSLGRAVVTFVFDGAKWVESGRLVQ